MLILLVEDDLAQIDSFKTAVSEWNKENKTNQFDVFTASSKEDAELAIKHSRIDCALVDIRIPESKDSRQSSENGNAIIKQILADRGFPIAVISGNISELDEDISATEHIKQFNKGDKDVGSDAIGWLGENWQMMDVLSKVRTTVEKAGAEIFGKRLWPNWNNLPELDGSKISKIVARQYASHLVEKLGMDHPENDEWHPYEAYVNPSLNEARAHTGDVFLLDGKNWVVLSPQCDMATKKISNVILCHCKEGNQTWDANIYKALASNDDVNQRRSSGEKLRKLYNQRIDVSEHFLPPLPGSDKPMMVEFKNLMTIELKELNDPEILKNRVASISSSFVSNLTQRFGAYISRAGQPNIDPSLYTPPQNP